MKLIEKTAKIVVSNAVKREVDGWPPLCSGLLYQPKRPAPAKAAQEEKADKWKVWHRNVLNFHYQKLHFLNLG